MMTKLHYSKKIFIYCRKIWNLQEIYSFKNSQMMINFKDFNAPNQKVKLQVQKLLNYYKI
jgi:hypothetical protein